MKKIDEKEEIVKISINFINTLKMIDIPAKSCYVEIGEIKQLIENEVGISKNQQILIFLGNILENDK